MTSGRMPPVVGAGDRLLLFEVAVLDHAGELDDAFELKLAPAAADAGPLERIDQPRRLGAQALARRVERRDALHQLRAGLDAPAFGVLDLAVHLLEGLLQRREQTLDRLLARVDIGGRLVPRLPQPGFGQVEKRSGCSCRAPRRSAIGTLRGGRFGFLVGRSVQRGPRDLCSSRLQACMRRPAGEPAQERAEPQDQIART